MAGASVGVNVNAEDILDASTAGKAMLTDPDGKVTLVQIDVTGAEEGDVLTIVEGVPTWQAPA